jgi:hypothetical protein
MGRAAGDRLHAPQQAPIRQLVSSHILGEALGAYTNCVFAELVHSDEGLFALDCRQVVV